MARLGLAHEPVAGRIHNRRRAELVAFYGILDDLEKALSGARKLTACSGRMAWPRRGVYCRGIGGGNLPYRYYRTRKPRN
jgi:hypothetical protein